ncbi:MAG: MBL fold metallo-hydrolase [Bryobacterales bacterium]|nr:MBL fold metallo-hydrolase [Bryobacterales bacterium]
MTKQILAALILVGAFAGLASAQDVRVTPVRGNIYMITGDGGNTTVSIGGDGALMVDTGAGQKSERLVAAVQQLLKNVTAAPAPAKPCLGCAGNASPYFNTITASPDPAKPIRYIINTSARPEHVGGNEKVALAGRAITGGDIVQEILAGAAYERAPVFAHENVLIAMSDSSNGKPAPSAALPGEVYNRPLYKLSQFINGEGIQIFHPESAISDGDSIVFFRYSDVISTGDIFTTTNYPMFDAKKGGSIQGVIDALHQILDLSVAENRSQGGTMIIPGHGRLCDSADVAYYRDMLTIIRDRVQDLMKKGRTLEQVKAAKATMDYDGRYATKEWTGDMFVEAVYNSLKK